MYNISSVATEDKKDWSVAAKDWEDRSATKNDREDWSDAAKDQEDRSDTAKDREYWSAATKEQEDQSVSAKDQVIECCRRWRLGAVEYDVLVLEILKIFQ